ncbi:probable glutamate receptor [Procambarus clarkii]|uniref:probable glutamate receptor n=1 Tax=Procambarus clarkii TaxID=6728 RepID=UPI003742C17F
MALTVQPSLLILVSQTLLAACHLPGTSDDDDSLTHAPSVLGDVLVREPQHLCSVIFLTDDRTYNSFLISVTGEKNFSSGLSVFEVSAGGPDANVTLAQLSQVVGEARKVRQASWCVTVVVVSDDLAFLAAVAQWSLKSGLLVWSTRLLVVTRLPLHHLHVLHNTFSITNSMLLLVEGASKIQRCSVYIQLPYSPRGGQALKVASWTPHRGLALTSSVPLFPDKFSRLVHHPTLVVAGEVYPGQTEALVDDPQAPDGRRLVFRGPAASVLDYLAQALNFSYTYIREHDGNFGTMLNRVVWKEADIALGPFVVSYSRLEVVDFSWPLHVGVSKILGGRGRPVKDPWSFLFPLTPLVWVATLSSVLVLPLTVLLLSSCFSLKMADAGVSLSKIFTYIRVLLQQDFSTSDEWWWERMVMLAWMMVTLVLTRSYSGNLLALLAVKYIPQPYQTLEDVVRDPSVKMIWKANTIYENYFRTSTSGIYREVGDLETKGRVVRRPHSEIIAALDTLVRQGDHVLMDMDDNIISLMFDDFLRTGKCDFYKSKQGYLCFLYSLVLQKNSPLLHVINKRVLDLTEAGFYLYSLASGASATTCAYPPIKVTVNTALAVSDLWGMFIIVLGGYVVGLLVLLLETASVCIQKSSDINSSNVN